MVGNGFTYEQDAWAVIEDYRTKRSNVTWDDIFRDVIKPAGEAIKSHKGTSTDFFLLLVGTKAPYDLQELYDRNEFTRIVEDFKKKLPQLSDHWTMREIIDYPQFGIPGLNVSEREEIIAAKNPADLAKKIFGERKARLLTRAQERTGKRLLYFSLPEKEHYVFKDDCELLNSAITECRGRTIKKRRTPKCADKLAFPKGKENNTLCVDIKGGLNDILAKIIMEYDWSVSQRTFERRCEGFFKNKDKKAIHYDWDNGWIWMWKRDVEIICDS